MEIFSSCIDFANSIGARIYTIHGDVSTSKGINNLEILIKEAQEYDIKVGLEIHSLPPVQLTIYLINSNNMIMSV